MKRTALATLLAISSVAALTAVLWWADRRAPLPDVPLIYIPIVIGAALVGVVPGVAAALASSLAFHIFFTAPRASLRVAATRDILSIIVYLAITVLVTLLISRVRAAAGESASRAEIASALRRLAATGLALSPTDKPEDVAAAIASTLGCPSCAIWMRDGDSLRLWAASGIDGRGGDHSAAAAWAEREGNPVGIPAEDGRTLRFVPLRGAGGVSGVVALEESPEARPLLDNPEFLEGLSGLVALLWARADTVERQLDSEAARRSDELKTALLSMVSHELRSPLTAIKATTGGLLHGASDADRESLEAIDGETDRLARLVRNLLDASRVEAGQLEPATHPVRLRRLVGELADRNGLGDDKLQLAVPADLFVEADPVLLNQVLQNLIENAERYGRPPVRVEAERRDGLARVSVTDRGPGVPAAALEDIFGRFVRLGRQGLGLGLAFCRAVVESHGGTIEAANASDGGLVVSFTIPTAEGDE